MRRRTEDYLEAIYNISKEKGVARTTDIAKFISIKGSWFDPMKIYIKYNDSL